MPARVKVKVIAGKNLPIMDRSSFSTDAFVEVRLGGSTYKTDVYRKSLNPAWNSEWYRFEIDDEELQEEALQIRVMDHDTYSAHDTIGRVYLDLNPLLERDGSSCMSGWFPIYDTMHGIRGEIHISVRVELFSDANRFRQSSLGVKFFYSGCVPHGWVCSRLLGFVEELVVNDDPEYHWIDRIRTSRASNEARQRLFSQLNGQLQRKLGRKVLEMEGNAVLGYLLHFDLEGESGIVVRGIGTAALLCEPQELLGSPPPLSPGREVSKAINILPRRTSNTLRNSTSCSPPTVSGALESSVNAASATGEQQEGVHDGVDTTSRTTSDPSDDKGVFRFVPLKSKPAPVVSSCITNTFEYQGFPFLTLSQYPPGFLIHIGGVVSAKSVKMLDRIHNTDEPLTRDAWWMELRTEIRSHMRALACHAVISYREETFIFEEIMVLSAYGTAAVVDLDLHPLVGLPHSGAASTLNSSQEGPAPREQKVSNGLEMGGAGTTLTIDVQLANQQGHYPYGSGSSGGASAVGHSCALLHAPYADCEAPFPVILSRCGGCRRSCVPDLLFASVDLPLELASLGALASDSALLQARVCRPKRDAKSESNAKEISDCLPFLEFELHRQLLDKLRLKGMNALFSLKTRLAIGEEAIVAISTATGYCLSWLPAPRLPRLCTKVVQLLSSSCAGSGLVKLQNRIHEHVSRNKKAYNVEHPHGAEKETSAESEPTTTTKMAELDLGGKDTFVIEVSDESEAEDLVSLLLDEPPDSCFTLNTLNCGCVSAAPLVKNSPNVQLSHCPQHEDIMFTRIWCGPLTGPFIGDACGNASVSNSNSALSSSTGSGATYSGSGGSAGGGGAGGGSGVVSSSAGAKSLSAAAAHQFSGLLHDVVRSTCFMFRANTPCRLAALDFRLSLPDENQLQIHLTGVCQAVAVPAPLPSDCDTAEPSQDNSSQHVHELARADSAGAADSSATRRVASVLLTPLYVPPVGRPVEAYLGNLDFFFVRETSAVRECGGQAGFLQTAIAEVQAVVRAHASCLQGNAVLAYHLSEAVLMDNTSRNQAQCLINVCGDIVRLASQ